MRSEEFEEKMFRAIVKLDSMGLQTLKNFKFTKSKGIKRANIGYHCVAYPMSIM
jgi:hypothetical protein